MISVVAYSILNKRGKFQSNDTFGQEHKKVLYEIEEHLQSVIQIWAR